MSVNINGEKFKSGLYCEPSDWHQFLEFNSAHPICKKTRLCLAKGCALKGYVPRKYI